MIKESAAEKLQFEAQTFLANLDMMIGKMDKKENISGEVREKLDALKAIHSTVLDIAAKKYDPHIIFAPDADITTLIKDAKKSYLAHFGKDAHFSAVADLAVRSSEDLNHAMQLASAEARNKGITTQQEREARVDALYREKIGNGLKQAQKATWVWKNGEVSTATAPAGRDDIGYWLEGEKNIPWREGPAGNSVPEGWAKEFADKTGFKIHNTGQWQSKETAKPDPTIPRAR